MAVYVNQVGFAPDAIKHATISGETEYKIKTIDGECVKEGKTSPLKFDESSKEEVAVIDFSDITKEGTYYIETASAKSYSFEIKERVYDKAFFDSMKMFYFQRCGMELEAKYAGKFTHKACHTKKVYELFNDKNVFECNGGWHDAGDYGRYVTAGAVALGHLLYAYEINPGSFAVELNIPESGNGVPDILNECRYELEWMLKMQKEDGSVYHKCTSISHTAFVMPEDDPLDFLVTPVSSMATADFAAVMIAASRIYSKFDKSFADKCMSKATKAYEWLVKNPGFLFENPAECTTGGYDDMCDADERLWAAVEMYRMTKREDCLGLIGRIMEMQISFTALGWGDVAGLASIAALTAPEGSFAGDFIDALKGKWIDEANRLVKVSKENGFELCMRPYDYRWGSNMIELINCDVLFMAYVLTGNKEYNEIAMYQLDYIFGRNAVNLSYVSGEGENSLSHPHNRPTESDGIDEMIPGFVSGGPNGHPCDEAALKMIPEGTAPMKCHVDDWGSYSTNEITIYWNSPLVFALSFICC